jgi:hypothetical protein
MCLFCFGLTYNQGAASRLNPKRDADALAAMSRLMRSRPSSALVCREEEAMEGGEQSDKRMEESDKHMEE